MRIAVYLRISEAADGDELGVTRQREDAAELIARRGWGADVRWFVENDTSATRGERVLWAEMMAAVESGELDVIVGWTLDRVLRSGRDRLRMLDAGRARGIILAPVRGSDMDLGTPAGRLTADILGAVAQNETEQKADRQRRAARQRAEQGRPWTSRRPFGYTPAGDELYPPEADRVRAAYADVLLGRPLSGIARGWNAAGVVTTRGNAWRQATVRQLILNERNAGLRTYRGEPMGAAAWPAIVDEGTFRAAVARLSDPSRRAGGGGRATSLLTGIATCGVCGSTVRIGRRQRDKVTFYRCSAAQHVSRTAADVDALVSGVIVARLARPDAAALFADDGDADADGLREEAADIRARIEALDAEYADGTLPLARHRKMNERMAARLADVERRMVPSDRAPALDGLIGSGDVAAVWDGLPLHRRRSVVGALVSVVIESAGRRNTFDPYSVTVTWR